MEVGSIWGHGSYVAPDWTADWLHREASLRSRRVGRRRIRRSRTSNCRPEDQGRLRGRLEQMYRHNSYDARLEHHPRRTRPRPRLRSLPRPLLGGLHEGQRGVRHSGGQRIDPGAHAAVRRLHVLDRLVRRRRAARRHRLLYPQLAATNRWSATARPAKASSGPASASSCCWPASAPWSGGTPRKRPTEPHGSDSRRPIPLGTWAATPSQRATLKYFWVVSALILVQILMGVVTAHYGVEGDGFYGIKLSHILPYSVSPHLARATRHLLDRHRLAGRRPVHRPAGQRQGTEIPGTRRTCVCSARCW